MVICQRCKRVSLIITTHSTVNNEDMKKVCKMILTLNGRCNTNNTWYGNHERHHVLNYIRLTGLNANNLHAWFIC